MGTIQEINDEVFEAEVLESQTPVLVDFWAPWCGPCRVLGKQLEEIATQRGESLRVVKLNIDDFQREAISRKVMLLPTVILFKDGEEAGRLQGGVPAKLVEQLLDKHLAGSAKPDAAAAPVAVAEVPVI